MIRAERDAWALALRIRERCELRERYERVVTKRERVLFNELLELVVLELY